MGLCCDCGETPEPGLKRCRYCLDRCVRAAKKLHARKLSAGLCPFCSNRPLAPGLKKCRECLDNTNTTVRELHYNDFLAACDIYGGRFCIHCGETNLEFLIIDHIFPRGKSNRVSHLSTWLRKKNYPAGYPDIMLGVTI